MKKVANKIMLFIIGITCFSSALLIPLNIKANEGHSEDYIEKNQGDEQSQIENEEILKKKNLSLNVSTKGWGDVVRPQMTVYRQDEDYYCGPANVKMVLQSINGKSYPQSTYASNMLTNKYDGTYVYRMVNEINNNVNTSVVKYAYSYIGSSSRQYLMDCLVSNIGDNYPAILHADTEPLYMYNGNSLGHYLTVDTVIADGSNLNVLTRVGYLDSYYKDYGRGNVFGRHTDSFENIFQAVLDRYLIW